MEADGGQHVRLGEDERRPTRIEALPPELLLYLSRFLDLSSVIVLSTATCRNLRAIFGQFDRELLYLEPGHRLCLAEWREAAAQMHQHGLSQPSRANSSPTSSAVDVGKAHSKATLDVARAVHELTRDESLIDLDLLKAVLDFLSHTRTLPRSQYNRIDAGTPPASASANAGANKIRSLHLTGWHGIAGAFIIQQLRLQPALHSVRTIVKTERADSRIWNQVAADDQTLVPPSFWPSIELSAADSVASEAGFSRCTSTQIIVRVGRRLPRRERQAYLRGEGLQIGYEGYCIELTSPETSSVPTRDGPIRSPCPGILATPDEPAPRGDRLHVVLQGREDTDATLGGWRHNEQLWVRSLVTCNHCKATIQF